MCLKIGCADKTCFYKLGHDLSLIKLSCTQSYNHFQNFPACVQSVATLLKNFAYYMLALCSILLPSYYAQNQLAHI